MKVLLALALAASMLPTPVLAQSRSGQTPEETKILALENAWNQAEEHKDVQALEQLLGDNLVYVDYDGSLMNKAEFLASVKRAALEPSQIVNDAMVAHVYGTAAVVTGLYREKGVYKGKPYLRHGRFVDTWIFRDGLWQCVASQSTLITH